ncbi:MAG: hypothetical protein HY703_02515, partial [Gemmatimonadetes bacterium]|nr:hypothetical protein [Gemmatimonadota bacterium]
MTSAAGAPSAHPAPRGLTLTPRRPIAALVAALLLFGACQGDNLFQTRETGGTVQGGDVRAPKVEIRLPAAGATIAARDSVLVEARLTDNVRLASVELVGLALRGSATLGTDTAVTRFSPKTVTFQGARRDTVVLRYLLPTAEAIAETVHIIVSAKDAADNVGADTVQVAVQGVQLERDPPRVDIRQPVPGATFPAGDSLLVEVRLRDASGLVSADLVGLAFRGNPTLGTDSVVTRFSRKAVSFAGALKDTVLFRYLLPTADNTTEQVRIIVSARDTLENTGADTVQINVDRDPPRVDLQLPTPSATFPAGDSVLVEVRLRDGSGLDSARIVGVSFRGDASLGTDTVVTRLLPKAIGFEKAPRDTVVRRYLLASADSSTERVHVIASAQDIARNVGADTVQVVVGGPRVEIVTPKTGQAVQAGQALAVKLSAADQSGVSSLQLDYSGVTSGRIVWSFSPAQRSVVRDTAVVLPAGVAGSLSLSATAQNALGVSGVAPQVSLS